LTTADSVNDRETNPGFLLLEDGTLFRGQLHGEIPPSPAEVVFTTNMSGYQEVFTDPSYGGQIVVMEPAAYEAWLDRAPSDLSLAAAGAQLFRSFGCSGCHLRSDVVRAPPLEGVFGSPVPLASGEVKTADEAYLRDSILLPRQDVVAGYQPIMPSFQDRISEGQLVQLIAYLKSLGAEQDERR